MNSNLCEHI